MKQIEWGHELNLWHFINIYYGQFRGYGRLDIRRLTRAAERMTQEELSAISKEAFRYRVFDALNRFPAYSHLVRNRTGKRPQSPGEVTVESLPVLSKSDIKLILAASGNNLPSRTISQATGGSTGKPFRFLITRKSFEWSAAVSDRGYSWAGAEEGRRAFYIWGSAITPPSLPDKLKARIHNRLQNRRFFNSFNFGILEKEECCRQIDRFKPVVIIGYAGNLVELAQYVKDDPNRLGWRAKTAITAAEAPRPGAKETIEKYLANELFLSYGSREFMLIGMECRKHIGYHISSDNLFVEVVDDSGQPLPKGKPGRIVITDLNNDATPFIRYEIGDLGRMGDDCPCGLPFPILSKVEGRIQESIILRSGEKLTALFIPHLMKEFEWVDGYQIKQNLPGEIIVNLITSDNMWYDHTAIIESHLRQKLGDDMRIEFNRVETLQKTASGKILIVVSNLDDKTEGA